jgi:hypothetical protein
MPIVIGGGAVAFVLLTFLTLITVFWILTKWSDFAKGLPVVGGALASMANYLRDRNLEILHAVWGVAHAAISWSVDRINDGFKILFAIENAFTISNVLQLINKYAGLAGIISGVVVPALNALRSEFDKLSNLVNGFVMLNIQALNFWRTTLTFTVNSFIIPSINSLLAQVSILTGVTIPTIQARLGAAETSVHITLPAEIAQTNTDVRGIQRVIDQTLTAPKTGLLDRVNGVEGILAQVMPWAVAIGLTIPVAANLAKLGRNPCWCTSEGPLQDNGLLELATMMDLI